MNLILVHADEFSYKVKGRTCIEADTLTEDNKSASVSNALIVFVKVEGCDISESNKVLSKALDIIMRRARELEVDTIVVYPYASLSPLAPPPKDVIRLVTRLAEALSRNGVRVIRAPYGWCRSFYLRCRSHPKAELAVRLVPAPSGEIRATHLFSSH